MTRPKKYILGFVLIVALIIGFLGMASGIVLDCGWTNLKNLIGYLSKDARIESDVESLKGDTGEGEGEGEGEGKNLTAKTAVLSGLTVDANEEAEPTKEELDRKLNEIIEAAYRSVDGYKKLDRPVNKPKKLGITADPAWKALLQSSGKMGKSIDPNVMNTWKLALSRMRYQCSSYWNNKVDVQCWPNESFCAVLFASTVQNRDYRMFFRSKISENGLDSIDEWKVYSVASGFVNLDLPARVLLVDQIIQARPRCTPFSSK